MRYKNQMNNKTQEKIPHCFIIIIGLLTFDQRAL